MNTESGVGTKSKLIKGELDTSLRNLERERKYEMRMHNTMRQQFRSKYSRFDFYLDRGKNSDVKLYQTHNPGFCFRRNGESKPVQNSTMSSSMTYEDIHDMLFTDGELDTDKVLCLHLLTAHKAETLTPPGRSDRPLNFLAKKQSPLERLIERSKKPRKPDNLTKLMPTYVLDITDPDDESQEEKCLIRDGRLAKRLIINDKIVQLVHTVLDALKATNPKKMEDLILKSNDEDGLKSLVEQRKMQEFLTTLHKQMIVYSCDSFHLTKPFKSNPVPLKLSSSSHSLKRLVTHIRKNVLQQRSQSTWRDMYDKSHFEEEYEEDEIPFKKVNTSIKRFEDDIRSNLIDIQDLDLSDTEVVSKSKSGSKNLRYVIGSGSRSVDSEDGGESPKSDNKTMDPEKRDSKTLNLSLKNEKGFDSGADNTGILPKIKKPTFGKPKKPTARTLDDLNDNNIQKISLTDLSKIINFHIKKLTSDVKTSKYGKQKSPSLREYKNSSKNYGAHSKEASNAVKLDNLDLAKITQKIREQETEKKMTRFLQNCE